MRANAGAGTWALLLGALLAYALAFQGSRGLFAPDEGRYVGVALEMLRDGDWVHPRLHPEQPHYTKPPLTYWALASSMAVLGRNEWAARLPNALAFAATVLLVWALARRLVPERTWLPPLVYATSLGPYVAANIVTTDTLLALWETLAVLAFVGAWEAANEVRRGRCVFLMWTALGLAFLTKGPPGLLPLLSVAVFVALRRGLRDLLRFARPAGLLAFVLVGVSWYVKVVLDQSDLLIRFGREVVGRVATAEHHRNPQWWGGLVVHGAGFLLGALPWTIPLLVSVARRLRSGSLRARLEVFLAREENLFLFLWLCLPLAVFLVSRSRLPLYTLPLFVPLSLLGPRLLPGGGTWRRSAWVALGAWAVVLAAARGAAATVSVVEKDDRALAAEIVRLAGRPGEVTFVGAAPRYGVGFYLDVEVERLASRPAPGPSGPIETLAEEWKEPGDRREGPRVYLVVPALAPLFERAAAASGQRHERLGVVSSFLVYREVGSR